MLLWAVLGLMLPLNFGIGRFWGVPWMEHLNVFTWATWAAVAVLAMAVTMRRSVAVVTRLGLAGILRPRWWMEFAYVSWLIATVFIAGATFGLLMSDWQRQQLGSVFAILFAAGVLAFLAFFAFASVGYLLAFARRLPLTGRAFDCVHYFYTILGSIGLVAYAAAQWPLVGGWSDFVLPAFLGITGVVWLGYGFVSIIVRYERYEYRHSHAAFPARNARDD